MNMTDILLTVSVGCNLWFLFLLLYDRIMETRFVRLMWKNNVAKRHFELILCSIINRQNCCFL